MSLISIGYNFLQKVQPKITSRNAKDNNVVQYLTLHCNAMQHNVIPGAQHHLASLFWMKCIFMVVTAVVVSLRS